MWWMEFNHDGPGFDPFGSAHLLVFAFVILSCIFLLVWRRPLRQSQVFQKIFCWSAAAVLLLSEIWLHAWYAFEGIWDIRFALPLHLSSFAWMAAIAMLLTKGPSVWTAFAFYAGATSASLTLVFPDIDNYGFPHLRFLHFFITHGLVITAVFYKLIIERTPITFRSLFPVWLVMNGLAAIVFFVNTLTGGNYMYLMEKPPSPTPFDWLGEWPYYLITLQPLAVGLFMLMYAFYHYAVKRWQ